MPKPETPNADAEVLEKADVPAPQAAAEPAPAAAAEPAPAATPAPAEAPPPLTAFLDHADKDASAVHSGVPVVRGKNGLYLVPLSFVADLLPHGFVLVAEGESGK